MIDSHKMAVLLLTKKSVILLSFWQSSRCPPLKWVCVIVKVAAFVLSTLSHLKVSAVLPRFPDLLLSKRFAGSAIVFGWLWSFASKAQEILLIVKMNGRALCYFHTNKVSLSDSDHGNEVKCTRTPWNILVSDRKGVSLDLMPCNAASQAEATS